MRAGFRSRFRSGPVVVVPFAVMTPTTVTPHYPYRSSNHECCQHRPWLRIGYNHRSVGFAPPSSYIDPSRSSIIPVSRHLNIVSLGRNDPIAWNPNIGTVSPPPVTIRPGIIRTRLRWSVIIHRLRWRRLC